MKNERKFLKRGIIVFGVLSINTYLLTPISSMAAGEDQAEDLEQLIKPGMNIIQKIGWHLEEGHWYYYDLDTGIQKGWLEDKGNYYHLDTIGAMDTGWTKVNGSWYYMNHNGVMQTGWIKLKNTWYYMNDNGAMQTDWTKIQNTWYYLNSNGSMQTGWIKLKNTWYYLNSNGSMQTGWVKLKNTWYYLNSNGSMQTGWIKLKNTWYYLNSNGSMATGFIKDKGYWYYLNTNGVYEDLTILSKNPTAKEFIDVISKYAVKIAEDNDIYASVIVAQAALETGYGKSALSKAPNHNLFGIKGYYNGNSVYMATKEHNAFGQIETIFAHFRKYPSYMESLQDNANRLLNGRDWNPLLYQGTWKSNTNNYSDATAALTGVYATDISYYQKLNSIIERNKLYELDGGTLVKNPTLANGWNKIDNQFYYVNANGVKLKGWQKIKNKWYYLGTTGRRETGWTKVSGTWYYLDNNGAMKTGWLKERNDWYYLRANGAMQVGNAKIGGKNYSFDSAGRMR